MQHAPHPLSDLKTAILDLLEPKLIVTSIYWI